METTDTVICSVLLPVRLEAILQHEMRMQLINLPLTDTVRINHLDNCWEDLRPFHIPFCFKNNMLSLTPGGHQGKAILGEPSEAPRQTRAQHSPF